MFNFPECYKKTHRFAYSLQIQELGGVYEGEHIF